MIGPVFPLKKTWLETGYFVYDTMAASTPISPVQSREGNIAICVNVISLFFMSLVPTRG